jgi:hypothetical protein
MNGIDAEERQVGLYLDDEIGQDCGSRIGLYQDGINHVKQKNAGYEQEHPVELPCFGVKHFISEQEEEENGADFVDITESEQMDDVVEHHAENQGENRQIKEMPVYKILHKTLFLFVNG